MLYGLICVPARKTSCSKAVVLATSVMFDVSSFPPRSLRQCRRSDSQNTHMACNILDGLNKAFCVLRERKRGIGSHNSFQCAASMQARMASTGLG